jgi:aromatic ring hydroxylase
MVNPHKMVLVLMDLFTVVVAATLAGLVEILFGVAAAAVVTTTPEPLQAAHRRLAEMVALVDRLVVVRQERSHLAAVAAPAQALLPALALLAKSSLLSSLHKDLTHDNLCSNR